MSDQYQDRQPFWAIWFDDADRELEIFAGEGAEEAAKRRYEVCRVQWNCELLVSESSIRALVAERDRLREQAEIDRRRREALESFIQGVGHNCDQVLRADTTKQVEP